VETIFPVINPPQVAIIGIGAPVERPWVVGGEVRPRTTLSISLAADHRVSDGHRGALLLNELATLLATPEKL
jgi:pyruvate dehydrogenase E2 component (dihydrolipoamide acetyltransferase)